MLFQMDRWILTAKATSRDGTAPAFPGEPAPEGEQTRTLVFVTWKLQLPSVCPWHMLVTAQNC
jgi:hypothetical protein